MSGIGDGPKIGMLKFGSPNCVWIARCYHCKRKTLAPVDRLLKRYGHHIPLHFGMNKLRCGVCKHLGAELYLGVLPDPDDVPGPGYTAQLAS